MSLKAFLVGRRFMTDHPFLPTVRSGLERSTDDPRIGEFMIKATGKSNAVAALVQIKALKKGGIGNLEMPAVV